MEQLREIRAKLPKGKKDPWAGNLAKRVLLQRALRKSSIAEFTDGELTVFNEWLDHVAAVKRANAEIEKTIAKIAQA